MSPYSICVIGNSHCGAYRSAWINRYAALYPGAAMTYFAAPPNLLGHLVHEEGGFSAGKPALGRAFALTSGGPTRIEPAAYDAVVLISIGTKLDLPFLCAQFGTLRHRRFRPVQELVSEACFRAMVEGDLRKLLEIVAQCRAASGNPLLVCPTPFRTQSRVEADGETFEDDSARAALIADYQAVASALLRERGAEMIWQDPATVVRPGYTHADYALQGIRLQDHLCEDGVHMNQAYGEIMLAKVLARLDALCKGRLSAGAEIERVREAG